MKKKGEKNPPALLPGHPSLPPQTSVHDALVQVQETIWWQLRVKVIHDLLAVGGQEQQRALGARGDLLKAAQEQLVLPELQVLSPQLQAHHYRSRGLHAIHQGPHDLLQVKGGLQEVAHPGDDDKKSQRK